MLKRNRDALAFAFYIQPTVNAPRFQESEGWIWDRSMDGFTRASGRKSTVLCAVHNPNTTDGTGIFTCIWGG